MTNSVNMSETEALVNGHGVPVYSGSLNPPLYDNTVSTSIANSEYLIRKSKEDIVQPSIPMFRAIFVVMNAAMGAGILNFPQAFARAGGISNAMTIQMIMLFFIIGSFVILGYCADKSGARNYQEIVRGMLGGKWYIFTEICVLLYMVGTAIAYMILIADQLEKVGEAISTEHHWYLSRNFLQTFVALVFILPLCLPKHLVILSYTSTLGSIGVAYIAFVAIYKYYHGTYNTSGVQPYIERSWTVYFAVIPTICFGYQVHVQAVSVYAELKKPSVPRFSIVCTLAMIFCCTAYSLTASFAYLTFGQKAKADILVNYDPTDTLANVARVALALVVFSSYASVCFCGRSSIEGLWQTSWRMSLHDSLRHDKCRRVILTVGWVGVSLLFSIFVKDIDYVISVIGGMAALFILFFPGLCLVMEVLHHSSTSWSSYVLLFIGLIYVFLGSFLFGESEVLAILQDLTRQNLY